MIVFNGKEFAQSPSISGTLVPKDTCIKNCLDENECILALMATDGYCINYTFSSFDSLRYIDEASESEGLMVAVKISAMECFRGSYLGIKMAYVDRRNDANYPFEWERKEDRWFTSCQCPDPNTIFRRSETEFVCVKRYVYNQGTSTGARQLCQKEGLKIIGIADQAELDALTGGIEKELCIDGTTTCTTGCTTSDYTFQDGITTSMGDAKLNYETTNGFCLYAMNGIVYAQDCDTATGSLEGSVLCGWKLTQ